MLFLVHVNFLPGGSISPEEFFSRINAMWSFIDEPDEYYRNNPRSGICISDFNSIQRFNFDLSVMPGSGISEIMIEAVDEQIRLPEPVSAPLASIHRN